VPGVQGTQEGTNYGLRVPCPVSPRHCAISSLGIYSVAVFLLLLLSLSLPVHARPQVLVILADHLTLSDVTRSDLPHFAMMRRQGQLALMSPGLAKKPDPMTYVYASLGAGDSIGVGDKSQGLMVDTLRRAGVRTALIGNADGDDTGIYRPALLFLPTPDVTTDSGIVADLLAPGGQREDPARLWAATSVALKTSDLVVVDFGDFARDERENERGFLLPSAYKRHRERALLGLDQYLGRVINGFHGPILLAVPTPPLQADGSWNSLTPFLALNFGALNSLSSDTTQTPGLAAARDLAPTILSLLQVPVPLQMTGASMRSASVSASALVRLDRLVRLNQEAQNAIFWAVGLVAGAIVFSGLGLYFSRRMTGRAGQMARYGLRILSAWPLALLLAPLAGPHTVNQYLLEIGVTVGLLALLPSPTVIFSLTALVLVGDGLTGTHLISNSALSEYALSGIRFYGIGNEYMGVLIGGALLACVGAEKRSPRPNSGEQYREETEEEPEKIRGQGQAAAPTPNFRLPKIGAGGGVLWFAFVTFVLSFPAFGAKAGGAVTATATFLIAWRLLQNRRVRWTHLVGSIALGFALVFLWAVLSHWLHLRRTHLETATDALGQGRFGYIAGVSVRKIGLAVRVALHPGTLLGLLAFAGLGLAIRKLLWTQVTAYLRARPGETAILKAGLWGCLVALLFNDSGIVAAILILQCLALMLLHGLYSDSLP
jgi:hypothetical protein